MIQRIQTIYLFLAAAAMTLLQRFPYFSVDTDQFFTYEETVMTIFSLVSALGLVVAIFMFKNRSLQMRIVRFAFLFILAFIGYAVYQFVQSGMENFGFEFGGVLPILAIILAILALKRINADEQLVKSSSSRLR